jgi:hypothetical protein
MRGAASLNRDSTGFEKFGSAVPANIDLVQPDPLSRPDLLEETCHAIAPGQTPSGLRAGKNRGNVVDTGFHFFVLPRAARPPNA